MDRARTRRHQAMASLRAAAPMVITPREMGEREGGREGGRECV